MTQLAARPKHSYPCTYKGFRLILSHGRIYGVPSFLDLEEILDRGRLTTHPAVLSAPRREELNELIERFDVNEYEPQFVGSCGEDNLFHYRGDFYGVPRASGALDLNREENRRAGVLRGATRAELEERLRGLAGAVPVEFAGWLPIYEVSGNCGRHPQFKHTADPPPGYRFTCSPPPRPAPAPPWRKTIGRFLGGLCRAAAGLWLLLAMLLRPFASLFQRSPGCTLRGRLRVLGVLLRLFFRLRRNGARLGPTLRFLRSRHYRSQLLLADHRGLVFLTSMPYTYGQNPWLIEIEDPTTLFYPFVLNGQTSELRLAESPYFPIVRTLLEADECRGILTHMKSTAELVDRLFRSDTIRAKITCAPLGVPLPERWQRHEEEDPDVLHLVFINSWCQIPGNSYVRGGLDLLEAFAILHVRYPQLRLTLRTTLPPLDAHFHRILESSWVRVINRFLSPEELSDLLAESHVFLLPAARVHIVSLLQAMAHGLAVVTSDGWGIDEYVSHERNGLVVKGRYGKVSWVDEEAGMLREDYEPMLTSDPEVVEGLVEAVSRLVEDHELRRRLGETARRDVETRFTPERWNQGLKEALDKARGVY